MYWGDSIVIFYTNTPQHTNGSVARLSSLKPDVLQQWDKRMKAAGLNHLTPRIASIPAIKVQEKLAQHEVLIHAVMREIEAMQAKLHVTHFFNMIDISGVVLKLWSEEAILKRLTSFMNLCPGALADVESAGYNSVILAMETGRTSLVLGEEHTLRIFHEGHNACTPIQVEGRIQAYVGFTFPVQMDPGFAIPLLQHMAGMIEKRLQTAMTITGREIAYKKFEAYQLTARQKEIAYTWLEGQTYVQIAECLNISVHTVRTVLKTVYEKAGVNSKAAFIRKFTL